MCAGANIGRFIHDFVVRFIKIPVCIFMLLL